MRFSARLDKNESAEKTIPMIVIGSLRAGGSGKTSVVMELARFFSDRGLRVAILAYRIGGGQQVKANVLVEVKVDSDWRNSSDEAVMMQRETGARVFVTRNRARAWKSLNRDFDLILSDDGFQDLRLTGPNVKRILLVDPKMRPGVWDLLPAGPYRETWKASARADLILEGPVGKSFSRELIFPEGFDFSKEWIVVCALGNNAEFVKDLQQAGVRVVKVVEGRNHTKVADGRILAARAEVAGGAGVLCSGKDGVKMVGFETEGMVEGRAGGFWVVGQRVTMSEEVKEKIAASVG